MLIDVVNREVVPFKAKFLNMRRLVSLYDDIIDQGNDNGRHELHVQILYLAIKRKKGK
jgi:hypothetical protein